MTHELYTGGTKPTMSKLRELEFREIAKTSDWGDDVPGTTDTLDGWFASVRETANAITEPKVGSLRLIVSLCLQALAEHRFREMYH